MKKFLRIMVILAAVIMTSCAKEPVDQSNPILPSTANFKIGNTVTVGDTTYAEPNIILQFYWDNLSLPMSQWTFLWNLGGTSSTSPEPQKEFAVGVYTIVATYTPVSGGTGGTQTKILKVRLGSQFENTIIPLPSTQNGNNWTYKFAMRTTAVENYANIIGTPWIYGSFTNPNAWEFQYITETMVINEINYLVYTTIIPVGTNAVVYEWLYGRGEGVNKRFSFAPTSAYWLSLSATEGMFRAYFKNGVMSFSENPIPNGQIPGNNGDTINGFNQPTIRTSIVYSSVPGLDSMRLFINYAVYANGTQPFSKIKIADNNWQSLNLIKMLGNYNGWGYNTFLISSLNNGSLTWRFGPNIANPTTYGEMQYSKFYVSESQGLILKVLSTKSSGGKNYEVITTQ